jgi:general secretion pathway protein E
LQVFLRGLHMFCGAPKFMAEQSSVDTKLDVSQRSRGVEATSLAFLDYLEQHKLLEKVGASRVRSALSTSGQPVDVILLELGLLPENQLADAEARFLGLERVQTVDFADELDSNVYPRAFFKNSGMVPLSVTDKEVEIATSRPFEVDPINAFRFSLGKAVVTKVATASEVNSCFVRLMGDDASHVEDSNASVEDDIERLKDVAREAPTIKLLNRLIGTATSQKASDIHIEPLEDQVRVRFRIDGVLQLAETLPKQAEPGLISRIKVLAKLNIAENRIPQDGRIHIPVRGRSIDLRVATTPTVHGETVTLRILDRQELPLDFVALGYTLEAAHKLSKLCSSPNGIVLVTGPTGSGKTTTLYAALHSLNQIESKIFTVEDPVEYHLVGVNQINVKPQIGLGFAEVLRSILRQDPDIVLIGEMRDLETARIAIQASLTGHLVLSTLHTNSAAESITRLLDMGIEPYLLGSCVRGVVAQRLLRKLCEHCKTSAAAPLSFSALGYESPVYEPKGCDACFGTGYSGRTVTYEIMEFTADLRAALNTSVAGADLQGVAQKTGFVDMHAHAMTLVRSGLTSLDEVHRVLGRSAVQ